MNEMNTLAIASASDHAGPSTTTAAAPEPQCPSCHRSVHAAAGMQGAVVTCTSCGLALRVPSKSGWRAANDWAPVWDWSATPRVAADGAGDRIGEKLALVFAWTQVGEHPDYLLHELAKATELPRPSVAAWIAGYLDGLTGAGRKATASLVLGACGLVAWLLPIVGLPVTVTGLVLGLLRIRSIRRRTALAGVWLSSIGLALTLGNAFMGMRAASSPAVVAPPAAQRDPAPPPARPQPQPIVTFDRADAIRLAEGHKTQVVNRHYDSGAHVEALVKDFLYDPATKSRRVNLELRWQGALTSLIDTISEDDVARSYVARGWLDVRDGAWTWTEQYRSKSLDQWIATRTALHGLADMMQERTTTKPATGRDFGFEFTNGCDRPVRLAIRYEDTGEVWRTAGWWDIRPGQAATLHAGGRPIRTRNAVWYYYAETTDGSNLVWKGEHRVRHGDRTLSMIELTDKQGDSDWKVTCK